MSKKTLLLLILAVATLIFVFQTTQNNPKVINNDAGKMIRYLPIGDSYTIGLGVSEKDRWPNLLIKHLQDAGINIILLENPAVSGYDVQDAIYWELPKVKNLQPDFVTVLIGANDNFRETNIEIYRKDLQELLDKLQLMLKNPTNIVLITIPDYSKTPGGIEYGAGEEISKGIEEYNNVIKDEAEKRNLKVADIFPISQTMTSPEDYISDGLHPSAKGYEKWEKVILPVVLDLLKTQLNKSN